MDSSEETRIIEASLLRDAWSAKFGRTRGQQREIAVKYGVHETFIGKLLNGGKPISTLWKVRMALFLGVKPQEIWPDFDLQAAMAEQLPPHVARLLKAAMEADEQTVDAAAVLLESKKTR